MMEMASKLVVQGLGAACGPGCWSTVTKLYLCVVSGTTARLVVVVVVVEVVVVVAVVVVGLCVLGSTAGLCRRSGFPPAQQYLCTCRRIMTIENTINTHTMCQR